VIKWLGPVGIVLLAILAELSLGRAASGPDFALFFGRFHPLVVHLPIGFFLLVALGEAATFHAKLRERVEPALGLLVPVSALAAVAAFVMGQLLALEGGFPAGALGWHRRLTLLAIIGMAACWVLYDRLKPGQSRWVYRGVMGATLGVLSLGAHFGGTMTRGESYLSKYAPAPLKPLLGTPEPAEPAGASGPAKPAAPAADPLVFQDVIQPILQAHCVECHGAEKQKGKLRLDSLEQLLKGGESGAAVVAGDAKKSPLLARMLLPMSDDDRMPPEGKPSPKPEELALIEFWIERGASPALKVKDLLAPTVSRALLEHALGGSAPASAVPVAVTPAADAAPPAAPTTESSAATSAKSQPAAAAALTGTPNTAAAPAAAPEAPVTPAAVTPAAPVPVAGVKSGPAFLATYCEKCHGGAKQKGKLRVDSLAALVKGGANGAALVPGSPEKSSIVQRIRLALDNDEHMPPKKEAQPSAAEVAVLAGWIRSGAGGVASPAGPAVATKPATPSSSSGSAAATPSAGSIAASASTSDAESPTGAAPPPSDTGAVASAPALDVSGPPDAALLSKLPPRVVLFEDAVQPLLSEKCGKCHIRDKPAGGLGVAKHAELLEGGFSGAGVIPRDRKASFVMQRLVLPPSDDEHMPPQDEPALSADEVELIGAWIDQGAPAKGVVETAKLTAGAARALSARGVKAGAQPEPLPAQAGGCGACSVPGAPVSKWLELQALALGVAALVRIRRRRRRVRP
jgi:uncharacterized membrane protein